MKHFLQKGISCLFLYLLVCITGAYAQELTVQGKVTDSDQEGLPGATILLKGTGIGTVTDAEGNYRLNIPDRQGNDILLISFVGYASQEISLNGRTNINVLLEQDIKSLNEVLVVGYGTQKKKDITGSVAVVDTEALKSIPSGSAATALQGQAAGVNVTNSGVPGGTSKISIRGITSFGDTRPLILVDGVQTDYLDNIDANSIESIQVLKDAGAAAIYGVRGANGVIVVTTKKGKPGKTTFSYDAYYGVQLPLSSNPYNLLNSSDYAMLYNIANPGNSLFADGLPDFLYGGPGVSGSAMAGDPAIDPSKYTLDPINTSNNYLIQQVNKSGTIWFDELYDPAPTMNHNLTASGGSDKANYLFSLGYLDQQGTLIETYFKRYSARINTKYKLNKHISIGENAYFFYKERPNNINSSIYVYRSMPIIPVYDIEGNFGGTFAGSGLGNSENPVARQKRTINDRNNFWKMIGNAYVDVDFLQDFTLHTSLGGYIGNNYHQNFTFTPYESKNYYSNPNTYAENAGFDSRLIWTNTLTYNKLIGKHSLKLLIGTEAIENSQRGVGGTADNFFSTDYDYLDLDNGTTSVTNYSNGSVNSLFSLFSRLDYAYNDRYLLGATVRRDGSSKFGADKRYGVFPSLSLGWRISEESFMKNISWLNDLKFRGSYGVLGSQNNVNANNAYSLYGGGFGNAYYDITGSSNSVEQGFIQTRIGNPNTGWEENIITNIGFDASLFNYKLNVSLEYYKKSIDGLLFTQPLPATVGGATYPVVNIGDIQNKGIDLSANYEGRIGNDWQFSIGTNITSYNNKVKDIPDPGYFDAGGIQQLNPITRNQEGEEVSSFFGYDVIGLFNSDDDVSESPAQSGAAPGRFKYRDVDGDGAITPDDRTFLGSPNPDFTYGLNLGVQFKGFDFSAIFYGSQGNELVNIARSSTHFFGGYIGNKDKALLNAWTPENTDTTVPKIENAVNLSTNGTMNSYFVEDGSYLKLRSLILGYSLSTSILQKIGVNKFRLYIQAANLFTITDYSGLDPEVEVGGNDNFGIDDATYPTNERSFLLGVNLSF